ncbi:hypothetical protein BX600DRAFT_508327 [Xylariales sp. PMI_506]|nr:hypothetical protein BX600DRAFT_508327 [Xylariales sp. PMI_506]
MATTSSDLDFSNTSGMFLYPTIVLNVLATVLVILRFYARKKVVSRFQLDDYLVFAVLILDYLLLIDSGIMVAGGLGMNIETLSVTSPERVTLFFQFYTFFIVSRTLRIAVWIISALLLGWGASVFFTSIFTCDPISGFWDLTIESKCINSTMFYIAVTIPNIIFDTATVFLPIREVWKLQLASDRKLAFTAIFVIGGMALVAAIARLVTVQLYEPGGVASNTTRSLVPGLLSTSFEINLALFGACLPPILPLLKHWFDEWISSSKPSDPQKPRVLNSIITFGRRKNRTARARRSLLTTTENQTTGFFSRLTDDGAPLSATSSKLHAIDENEENGVKMATLPHH